MDDILVAAEKQSALQETSQGIISAVQNTVFTVAKKKIQQLHPWKYLECKITEQTITPQTFATKRLSTRCSNFWEQSSGFDHY